MTAPAARAPPAPDALSRLAASLGRLETAERELRSAWRVGFKGEATLLAELYLDRGWRAPAADKLALLGRLTDLTADDGTKTRLCALAKDRLPDDVRLAAICA